MKRTALIFVISALIVAGLVLWAVQGHVAGNLPEIVMAGIVLILVGFALYVGVSRLRSLRRKEPAADEMTKKIMARASSLAFYISIYLWLFVMYISDKTKLHPDTLIGAGILGMAMVFLLCWLGMRAFGIKNE